MTRKQDTNKLKRLKASRESRLKDTKKAFKMKLILDSQFLLKL